MLNGRSRVTSENLRSAGGRSRFCSAWPCARFQRSSELSRQQRRFFYPCKIESLFKDLHLHDLAAEQAFEVPNSLLQPTNLGCGNHILIGPDRLLTPFAHQPSPSEDQARGEPMSTHPTSTPGRRSGLRVCGGAQAAAALDCRVAFQFHGSRSATLLTG